MATTTTTTTAIHIRPARWADLPAVARLLARAYWDNNLMAERLHPHRHAFPADFTAYWLRQLRSFFWDWRSQFLVAVEVEQGFEDDDAQEQEEDAMTTRTGQKEVRIAGYAHWERKGQDETARKMDLWRLDPRNLLRPLTKLLMRLHAQIYPNRAADPAWLTAPDRSYAFFVPTYWPAGTPRAESWFLECLGVDPACQGRRVGRRLVRWGLARAAREAVCASVIVALGKDGFYQKCGFDEQWGSARDGEGNPLRDVEGWNIWWRMPKPKDI